MLRLLPPDQHSALSLGARFGVSEQNVGWFFVYSGMLSLLVRSVLLGPIVDRIGEASAVRVGAIILGIGLLLYPVASSIWMLVFIIPFVPVGTALLFPASTSLLSRVTDPHELGTVMGVAQTFAGISRVIAPVFGTIAFQRLGVNSPFLLGGVTMLIVAWTAFRFVRPPETVPAT